MPQDADSLDLKLEVLRNGEVIRTITNSKPKDFKSWQGGPPKPVVLPSSKGHQRFTWDFRRDGLPAVDNVFVFGDYKGSRVAPGNYAIRLTLEDEVIEQSVRVMANPNLGDKAQAYSEQQKMLQDLAGMITEIHSSVNQMRSARNQLEGYKKLLKDNDSAEGLLTLGDSLIARIDTWEKNLIQPEQKTFQDVINFNNQLNAEIMYLRGFIDNADPELTQGARERFKDLQADWKVYSDERDAIVKNEMAGYNSRFKELNLPAIIMEE